MACLKRRAHASSVARDKLESTDNAISPAVYWTIDPSSCWSDTGNGERWIAEVCLTKKNNEKAKKWH